MKVWKHEVDGGLVISATMTVTEAAWLVVGLKARLSLLPSKGEAAKANRDHYISILDDFAKAGVV